MNDTTTTTSTEIPGKLAGIIACVLGGIGILFFGIIFVPLAFIAAIIGTIAAVKHKNPTVIWINALAWVLTVIGFFTSPLLWGLFFGGALLAGR